MLEEIPYLSIRDLLSFWILVLAEVLWVEKENLFPEQISIPLMMNELLASQDERGLI